MEMDMQTCSDMRRKERATTRGWRPGGSGGAKRLGIDWA
jgi:hypothetical protein